MMGGAKIVPQCNCLPLTARAAVHLIITDLAVFSFEKGQLYLKELMPGASLEEVRTKTSAYFIEAL
ncbi:MAG: hypothetical protein R2880_12040 [Deinococcales bacterium]